MQVDYAETSSADIAPMPSPAIHKPQLLISVRNSAEADAAIAGGADWIDVKEPLNGSLGRPSCETVARVVRTVAGRRPVTMALGELRDLMAGQEGANQLPMGVGLAKIGLSGCRDASNWTEDLGAVAQALPSHVGLVAVQYADWWSCGAPEPKALLEAAHRLQCVALLVDTFDKRTGTLLDHLPTWSLQRLFSTAAEFGMKRVAAGGLRLDDLNIVRSLGVDVVAARSAACERGQRTTAISTHRVVALRRELDTLYTKLAEIS